MIFIMNQKNYFTYTLALANTPLHRDQYAYKAGISIETALSQIQEKARYAYKNNELLLATGGYTACLEED